MPNLHTVYSHSNRHTCSRAIRFSSRCDYT